MKILLVVMLLLVVASAQADEKVYKSIGSDGVVTFSDTPSRGATQIEIKPAPSYRSVPLPPLAPLPALAPAPASAPAAQPTYQSLRITRPRANQTIVNTAGNFTVSATLSSPLMGRDKVQFLIDGKPIHTGTALTVVLHNINRGAHTLRVQVLGPKGNIVLQSGPVVVFLHRPSVYLPGHRAGHPAP